MFLFIADPKKIPRLAGGLVGAKALCIHVGGRCIRDLNLTKGQPLVQPLIFAGQDIAGPSESKRNMPLPQNQWKRLKKVEEIGCQVIQKPINLLKIYEIVGKSIEFLDHEYKLVDRSKVCNSGLTRSIPVLYPRTLFFRAPCAC